MTSGFANTNNLTIIGAGTIPTGTAKGAATSGGTTVNLGGSYWVNYTGVTNKKFRIANFTFTGAAGGLYGESCAITVSGTSKYSSGGGWRVDHITFQNTGNKVNVRGYTYGVVDHVYYLGVARCLM